jgi:DNA-binding HxlR family transcriptional regulator
MNKLDLAPPIQGEGPCDGTTAICPVSFAMSLIGGKWKCIILYHICDGPMRFGALRRSMPSITQRMLTLALRELEADGLVNRDVRQVVPPHVEYSLTALGEELKPVLASLQEWGLSYFDKKHS